MDFTRTLKYYVFVPLYNIKVAKELLETKIFDDYLIIKSKNLILNYGQYLYKEDYFTKQLFQDIAERHPDKLIWYPFAEYVLCTEFSIEDNKEVYTKKVYEIRQQICNIILSLRLISSGRCQIYNGYYLANGHSACSQFKVSSQLLNMERSHRTYNNSLVVENLYELTQDKLEKGTTLFKILQTLPKNACAVPIVYFNKYYDSLLPHERIIQLAIFIESTLLAGQTDELNYRLCQRASAFLGKDLSKIFKLFYAIRSQIVHNGHINQNKDGKDIIKRLKKLLNSDSEDETKLLFYFVNDCVEPVIREILHKSLLLISSGTIKNFEDLTQQIDDFIVQQITMTKFETKYFEKPDLVKSGVKDE